MNHVPSRSTYFPYTTLFRSPLVKIGQDPRAEVLVRKSNCVPLIPPALALFASTAEPRCCRSSSRCRTGRWPDRKSTRLNSSHVKISYAVFCLKKKNNQERRY